MKDLNYYMRLPYTVVVHTAEEGGFVAEVAELPGCLTQGETLEELWAMVQDAKRAWIEAAIEEGIPVPEPVSEEYSGRLVLRMPRSLHRALAERARSEGVSLNQFITYSLARVIGMGTPS
ncbi:MAG: type II toxin-antitoxin system HicB family antitoxin [Desulfotomaculales bacterium]